MRSSIRCFFVIGLLCSILPLAQCATPSSPGKPETGIQAASSPTPQEEPYEAEYSAEILAYLMQVVLGKAGNPDMRSAWYHRAETAALDLRQISQIMTDPSGDKKQILVLDNNILGLLKILYHYNVRLNLFKGKRSQESVFPSAELLAIRMLLLQKLHQGEKIDLAKLVSQKDLLKNPKVDPEAIESAGTGLNATEIKLLKDVVDSEPFFMAYLENPFVVDTLYRIGVVNLDSYVKEKIEQATYLPFQRKAELSTKQSQVVTIAMVPSFTMEFQYRKTDAESGTSGFVASQAYQQATRDVRNKVMAVTQALVKAQLMSFKQKESTAANVDYGMLAGRFLQEHVAWVTLDDRPFAIYPENARRMMDSLCPQAEFTIIIMGENVYLSFNITELDGYPNVNRIFIDIMDIRHDQVDYELSQVGMFIFNRLRSLIKPSS